MSSGFVDKGKEYADKAMKHEEKQEYQEALKAYLTSLEYFTAAHKHEKIKEKAKWISDYAGSLADRAEKIKEYLDNAQDGGGKGGGNASAQAQKGKGDKKKEDEDDKMRANLEGAVVVSKPNVRWDDVAGLEGAKEALREAVILPIKFPQLFTGERKPWKGILMYGPPGTGKSYLAKAVATESDCTFFSISSADIMSKWVGESEKLVRNLFRMARERKPAIIFVDEVDSMCSARGAGDNDSTSRVKTEFLVQMQGVGHDDTGVLVLAATNLPHQLDAAIRRRFERRIEIPLPDCQARSAMFKLHIGKTPHSLKEEDFDYLGRKAEGYSGSDISVLVRQALFEPVRTLQTAQHFKEVDGPDPNDPESGKTVKRLVPCAPGDPDPSKRETTLLTIKNPELVLPPVVGLDDFEKAFRSARPSVSQDDLAEIQKFTKDFGQEG
eukprot:TRINITY_DN3626_c0_g3_i1.p1 TRINITY_DN3626_c0_g3~~TRINITY_DN3626_c0_g3_i1.p1  ORF type:complete len:471 (+),score=167.35 TRINITY_DN3626_c0_g3_i1:98-1414(+)